jgi:hypothetical protein
MRYLTALIALLMLAGCASTRRAVNTYQMQQDSTYNSVRRLDSLFRVMMQRDSTYRRDSIYIWEKGDTITKYVERTKYRIVTRTDTLYRDRLRTDTLYINRTDSVTVEKPVYIEKQMKWYDKGFIWVGRLCCLAAILWALFLYLKRKF